MQCNEPVTFVAKLYIKELVNVRKSTPEASQSEKDKLPSFVFDSLNIRKDILSFEF